MILAEKIIMLRKKNGWSQEELAMKMNVSRQSVSKWESAASIPDLNKILMLSELFGVTTDYLLKDEIEETQETALECFDAESDPAKKVTVEEANEYLNLVQKSAAKIAGGVALCILSPIFLIILGGLSEYKPMLVTENAASGIGVTVLLLMVAAAVADFILTGTKLGRYEYLETEVLSAQYGVESLAEKKKQDFEPVFTKCIAGGVALCILSVVPLMIVGIITKNELAMVYCIGILLAIVAAGVFLLVWAGMIHGSYQKLLQEGDYTVQKKEENAKNSNLSKIYWCTITAVYLGISFITRRWDITWVIWPCAGVFFAALCGIAAVVRKGNK